MPVELHNKKGGEKRPKADRFDDRKNRNLVLYDNRQREVLGGKYALGHNGFVILTLDNDQLRITYYDDNNMQREARRVLEEVWRRDPNTGSVQGESIVDYTEHEEDEKERLSRFNPSITVAIGRE
jgi:hydrogenase maturation factor